MYTNIHFPMYRDNFEGEGLVESILKIIFMRQRSELAKLREHPKYSHIYVAHV